MMTLLLALSTITAGYATWYDDGPGVYGAAGPALRAELGADWRGQTVQVCGKASCIDVKLSDWCACGPRHGKPTVIDLSPEAFAALSPLGRGVITVEIRGPAGGSPELTIPPSDTPKVTGRRVGMMFMW